MRTRMLAASLFAAVFVPVSALACDGPAGTAIAISYNGNSYTVTNVGRAEVAVTFNAWGKTYSLSLAPGQSGTPSSGGLFNLPMHGYQSCIAVPVATR